MDQVRKRRERYAQLERKRQREEIMIEKRLWIEPPSPVVEIPLRIEQQIWVNFQTFLDSFGEREFKMVDASFRKHIQDQWLKHSSPEWNNENAVNILRIIFRLQLVQKTHAKAILDLAFQARSVFQESNDPHAGNILLLLIKQIAIHLEYAKDNQTIWEGEIQQLLNQFVSTLKIYRSLTAKDKQFQETFKEWRIYYIVLLVDHRVNLQQFVRLRNVGELYQLIDDCINLNDSQGQSKYIKLIKKMLEIKGNQEVEKCLNGVSVVLIEGVQQAKCFLNDEPYQKEQKGRFFTKFLKDMTSANFMNVKSGIELLAMLFDRFDECIPLALQVRLLPFMEEELMGTSSKFTTYTTFIECYLVSMDQQVRWNCLWVISNITGSTNYFRQYGLPLLAYLYQRNYFFKYKDFPRMDKEITICVLNYVCNISRSEELQQLFDIRYEYRQIEQEQKEKFTYSPNCLLFCIDVACKSIKEICLDYVNSNQIGDAEEVNLIHRAVYALLRILENAENHTEMVVAILEREQIDVMLENLNFKLISHYQKTIIYDLIIHFLNTLNTCTNRL